MIESTTIYIFNENGILKRDELDDFCLGLLKNSRLQFDVKEKKDIDLASTVYKKLLSPELEFIVYDYGYVMKIEGRIREAIILLMDIDSNLDESKTFHVSPSQIVVNMEENNFPRGASMIETAQFLNAQFNNEDYTDALKHCD